MLREKLTEALDAKNNDVNSFVWKYSKKDEKPDVKLMDATPEELQTFMDHCRAMLYNTNKRNPGRYVLLNIISEYRQKCNAELYLRALEDGSLMSDGRGYPRHMYYESINNVIFQNKIPDAQLFMIPINQITQGVPREFENLSVAMVRDACVDELGIMSFKHITSTFILNLGVYFTSEEQKELTVKDSEGKNISKLEVLKLNLKINPNTVINGNVKGLSYSELKAIWKLKSESKHSPIKFSAIETGTLLLLRNKLLFKLENTINSHITFWEHMIGQILKVAEVRGITLNIE